MKRKADRALKMIAEWLEPRGLRLAPEKSEAIYLTGRREFERRNLWLEGVVVEPAPAVRYLGYILDTNTNGGEHLKMACAKAAKAANQIARLMPNMDGPKEAKRRLLTSVVKSILLFASPVWPKAMLQAKERREALRKVQRTTALRTIRAYKTVGTMEVLVLTGDVPWDYVAAERKERYESPEVTFEASRESSLRDWQIEWREHTDERNDREDSDLELYGEGVGNIVPDIRQWLNRPHGVLSYHLTQALTGHGNFGVYLKKHGLKTSDACEYCETAARDTVRHTIFECPAWENVRRTCPPEVTGAGTVKALLAYMLQSEERWSRGAALMEGVMRQKQEEKRERERRPRRGAV